MGEIKPIETYYNGYRFRSRLEARWAVFFDALGVKYEYEPEGYCMSDGSCYLPDFFLPGLNYYVEVKGMGDHIVEDIIRLKRFVLEAKTAVVILSNIPYDPNSKGLFWFPIQFFSARGGGDGIVDGCRVFFGKRENSGYIQWDFLIGCRSNVYLNENFYGDRERKNNRIFSEIQPISGMQLDDYELPIKDHFEDVLIPVEDALRKARQARFEHGERG